MEHLIKKSLMSFFVLTALSPIQIPSIVLANAETTTESSSLESTADTSTTESQTTQEENVEYDFDTLMEVGLQVEGAVITIGQIVDGEASYTVYTAEGAEDFGNAYEYELGSITKTFTGTLIAKAVDEGLISLDEPISTYINFNSEETFPTVLQLLTHTSGYPTLFENETMAENIEAGVNPFMGISKDTLIAEATENLPDMTQAHPYEYSNFNAALLGLLLEAVYGTNYYDLANTFVADQLQLPNTYLFENELELGNNWVWSPEDAYAPAGAMVSNIEDMLLYLDMQMNPEVDVPARPWIDLSHQSLVTIDATTEENNALNIRHDEMAYLWILDTENNIIYHDGSTEGYTSYIGFNPEEQIGVVVLANLPLESGVPGAALGAQLLTDLLNN